MVLATKYLVAYVHLHMHRRHLFYFYLSLSTLPSKSFRNPERGHGSVFFSRVLSVFLVIGYDLISLFKNFNHCSLSPAVVYTGSLSQTEASRY